MDFFAGIAVRFEAVTCFEEFDLIWVLGLGGSGGLRGGSLGQFWGSLLGLGERKYYVGNETRECECAQIRMDAWTKLHDGLAGSLGRRQSRVKRWAQ